MNQLTYKHLAAALLVAFAGAASAQSTQTVTTTGTVSPGTCALTIAGGANFAYGNITPQALIDIAGPGTGVVRLHEIPEKTVSVVCDGASKVRLSIVDNNANPGYNGPWFGLGVNGVKVAQWNLKAYKASLDNGGATPLIRSGDSGATWTASDENWSPATSISFVKDAANLLPDSFTTLSFQLRSQVDIFRDTPITTATPFAGSATITLFHL